MSADRTAVTGLAWTTPLGDGLSETWEKLCAGASGVASVPSPHRLRTTLAAAAPGPPYRPDGTEAWERQVALAVRTIAAALKDAGLSADDERLTLVLGTSFGAQLDSEEPPEDWAAEVAGRLGHPGQPIVVTTACSAGSDSLLVADALIRDSGGERIFVAGGVDVLTEAKRLGHSALGTMSPTGLRAFDTAHDGMILGEGAGFLVLESQAMARRRNARTYVTLNGAGSANDASGLTAPDPSGRGVTASVRRSLAGSGVDRDDVAVICAHGTGTPLNDEVEAAALQRLFGDVSGGLDPVLFGTKGALGHSLGATGAIEAVATVLALCERSAPPLPRLASPLPGLSLRLPSGLPEPVRGTAGISLTLGFGGFNTCLLFTTGPSTEDPPPPSVRPDVRNGRRPLDSSLAVVGHARLTDSDPVSYAHNQASFYADPLAWMIASAVEKALAPHREHVLAEPDEVAVLVTTNRVALSTHRRIAQDAARGRVSPLRFAGANPGILAGLTCITFGFRGPSLVLVAAPDVAANTSITVAKDWLSTGRARYVLRVAHHQDRNSHTADCSVLRIGGADEVCADATARTWETLSEPPGTRVA